MVFHQIETARLYLHEGLLVNGDDVPGFFVIGVVVVELLNCHTLLLSPFPELTLEGFSELSHGFVTFLNGLVFCAHSFEEFFCLQVSQGALHFF